jgi:hypothetical protein
MTDKQLALKPFDFVLAVKIGVNPQEDFRFARLAEVFGVSLSTVHGAIKRAEAARLLSRSAGSVRAINSAVREFAIHGAKYAFPATTGPSTRGIPTAIGAPILAQHFESTTALVPVWPSPDGRSFGFELVPLHPTVPRAAQDDEALYAVLALVDAVRAGAAREREIAITELQARL